MPTFEKMSNSENYPFQDIVTVVYKGDFVDIRQSCQSAKEPSTRMIDADHYIDMDGVIYKVTHHDRRTELQKSLLRTFHELRDIINTNIRMDNRDCIHWVTLTWADDIGMDSKRIQHDFRLFWGRFKTYLKCKDLNAPEYITVVEPTAKGRAHLHALFIWDKKAPFIPKSEFASIWKYGFVKIKYLNDCGNNIGAYLTAYLTDISTDEIDAAGGLSDVDLTKIKIVKKQSKQIVKGGRLRFYPAGFRIFRASNGIRRPHREKMWIDEANYFVKDATLVNVRTFSITDGDFSNIFRVSSYNIAE